LSGETELRVTGWNIETVTGRLSDKETSAISAGIVH
jgi:hypothetical protein